MVDYVATAANTADMIWWVIPIVLGIIILLVIIITIFILLQYKHHFRVRELTGGKTRIIDDKAKEVKDKTGVLKWRLFKRKHNVPVPPADAIHLTKKGKYSVEAYYTQTGEYKYVIDEGINPETLSNFKPLDTQDREFYANEMQKAEQYKKKKWTDYILPLSGVMVIMMVFILMLVFWEDIAKPGIQITATASGIAETQAETVKIMRDIIQNRQTVEDVEKDTENGKG